MWLLVFLAIVISWVAFCEWRRRRLIRRCKLVPSQYMALPFIGHCYKWLGNDEDFIKAIRMFGRDATENGGMSCIWLMEHAAVHVADAVTAEFFLRTCLDKGHMMRFVQTGNGLLTAPVSIWRIRRKHATPPFSAKNLKQLLHIFVNKSTILVEKFREKSGVNPFSVFPYFTAYSMDVLCESTFGVDINVLENPDHPFLRDFNEGTEIVVARIFSPWLYSDTIFKLCPSCHRLKKIKRRGFAFIDQIIQTKRTEMREKINTKQNCNKDENNLPQERKTFMELVIESSSEEGGYSDVEIRDETLVFLIAGIETTSVAAGFVCLMLARHQDVQQKVYQEITDVFGDSSRQMQTDDLLQLKYLESVIKETMRLYPPVPLIVRSTEKDVDLPSGETFPKGCTVMLNIWALHRNPRYWGSDAEVFRPERFLDTPLKHPAQYVAFSHGPRNCLGYQYAMMSLKVMLATLLRQYRVLPETEGSEQPLRLKYGLLIKDYNNFTIRIEPRQ